MDQTPSLKPMTFWMAFPPLFKPPPKYDHCRCRPLHCELRFGFDPHSDGYAGRMKPR